MDPAGRKLSSRARVGYMSLCTQLLAETVDPALVKLRFNDEAWEAARDLVLAQAARTHAARVGLSCMPWHRERVCARAKGGAETVRRRVETDRGPVWHVKRTEAADRSSPTSGDGRRAEVAERRWPVSEVADHGHPHPFRWNLKTEIWP